MKIVVSVTTCFGKRISHANLLNISGSPDHSQISFMSYQITLVNARHSLCYVGSGTEMDAAIDNGRHPNSNILVENLHFLDSLNYVPMGLRDLPKLFEYTYKKLFEYTYKKGHCSHIFL